MVCPKCGATVDDNVKFCPYCGAELVEEEKKEEEVEEKEAEVVENEVEATEEVKPAEVEYVKGSKGLVCFIIAYIGLSLTFAGIICIKLLGNAEFINYIVSQSEGYVSAEEIQAILRIVYKIVFTVIAIPFIIVGLIMSGIKKKHIKVVFKVFAWLGFALSLLNILLVIALLFTR